MTRMRIRDVSLFVEVVGHGYPLVLMHGGPGADHYSLLPFRRLADRYTLVFYDHRCKRAGHNPYAERSDEVMGAIADFIFAGAADSAAAPAYA